jgi:hypothetical protein
MLRYLNGTDYLSGDQISGAHLRAVWSAHAHYHHRSPAKEIGTAEGYFLSMPALRMHSRRPTPKRVLSLCIVTSLFLRGSQPGAILPKVNCRPPIAPR